MLVLKYDARAERAELAVELALPNGAKVESFYFDISKEYNYAHYLGSPFGVTFDVTIVLSLFDSKLWFYYNHDPAEETNKITMSVHDCWYIKSGGQWKPQEDMFGTKKNDNPPLSETTERLNMTEEALLKLLDSLESAAGRRISLKFSD